MSAPRRPLRLSRRARTDLRDIQGYSLANWGEQLWAEYEEALAQALAVIMEYPESGRRRPELGEGLRSYPVREHIIYYRVSDEAVLVLRVQHNRRDPRRAVRGR
jgi:toxin ParE1/3/4